MPDLWMDVDANLAEVPVNIMPLLDDTNFKSREESVAYNAAGLELIWHFTTTAGATTATVVTPTTGGNYDWAHQDGGMYTIEIPASGGASINNDTEGFGWFTGVATGVLPWRGPVIGFRAAGLNNVLIDSAYSATRGLAGTALPDAAADAAGGLPISDAGGLNLDAQIGTDIDAILVDTGTTLQGELDGIQADTEDIQSRIPAALIGGRISADVGSISADATAADNLEAACDGGSYNVGGGAVVAASVTGAVGSVTGAVGSVTGNVGGNVTGSVGSVAAGGITATSIATGAIDADAIAADAITAAKIGTGAFTADAFAANAIVAATLAANCITASQIADGAIDAGAFATGAITATAIAADAIGASELAADAVAEIADQVWDEAISGHAGAGSTGAALAAATAPTAAAVADAVWDETIADHAGVGSTGAALSAAGGSGDPWSTALPGSYGAGTAGYVLGTNLNAPVGTVDTVVDGLATELAKVPKSDSTVSWNATALAAIQGEVTDALNAYDPPTNTEMAAAFTEVKGATWSAATDTLEHIRNKETDIETDTQDLQAQVGTDGAGLTSLPWNAAWDAEVQSEATDALNAYDPPTKAELDTGLSAVATAANLATVDTVVDGLATTLGVAGAGLTAVPWNASWDAEVQSEVDDALGAAITEPTNLSATKSVKFFLWALFSRLFHLNTQTATQQITYKADGTTAFATRTVSDDGTTQTLGAGA
jgi:hypothetical protein